MIFFPLSFHRFPVSIQCASKERGKPFHFEYCMNDLTKCIETYLIPPLARIILDYIQPDERIYMLVNVDTSTEILSVQCLLGLESWTILSNRQVMLSTHLSTQVLERGIIAVIKAMIAQQPNDNHIVFICTDHIDDSIIENVSNEISKSPKVKCVRSIDTNPSDIQNGRQLLGYSQRRTEWECLLAYHCDEYLLKEWVNTIVFRDVRRQEKK